MIESSSSCFVTDCVWLKVFLTMKLFGSEWRIRSANAWYSLLGDPQMLSFREEN